TPGTCDLNTVEFEIIESDGSFVTHRSVRRLITVGSDNLDCAVPGACVFGAANADVDAHGDEYASTPIEFDPNIPPVVAKIKVTPDSNLTDHQAVTVSGTGFSGGDVVALGLCPESDNATCDFDVFRLVNVGSNGTFKITNFVVERKFITIDGNS